VPLKNQKKPAKTEDIAFSVDLISDLQLVNTDDFDWTDKATSLYCCIAGNISSDLHVVKNVLLHLGSIYRGVFYIDGTHEHISLLEYETRIDDLTKLCKSTPNVVYLHNHVVLLNGYAFIGINGWYNNSHRVTTLQDMIRLENYMNDDLGYLSSSIRNLQLHGDAKKLIILSGCVPNTKVLYTKDDSLDFTEPALALIMDTDKKVSHWLYGGTDIVADAIHNKRRYVNNPRIKGQPYYAKRIVF
jgi:predicted phosphohydrolase